MIPLKEASRVGENAMADSNLGGLDFGSCSAVHTSDSGRISFALARSNFIGKKALSV